MHIKEKKMYLHIWIFKENDKFRARKKAVETTRSLVAHQTQLFTWTANKPVSNKKNLWRITVAHIY